MKKYDEIYENVKSRLSEYRFHHSKCVSDRCVELATIHNSNVEAAKLIGLVHDMAKEIPNDEKIKYCQENNLNMDDVERSSPGLLHGKIAAHMAKNEFGFSEDLCSAIQYHTTGKANMSLLDKILYVADMTSADREFPEKEYVVNLGNENLDKCVKYILEVGITSNIKNGKKIQIDSIKALNYFNK